MRRRTVETLAIATLAVLVVAALAGSVPPDGSGVGGDDPGGDRGADDDGGEPPPSGGGSFQLPLGPLFLGLVGLLICGALLGLYRVVGRTTNPTFDPTGERDIDDGGERSEDHDSLEHVADAAGRTADRLERANDVVLENEIYRAWREMTDHLSVPNRRSRTPGEFATAAVRAGMAESDVQSLTELFEAVRYGEETPTDEDEDRAIALLRDIESTYGDAE